MIREVNYATYAVDHRDHLRIISFNEYFTTLTGFTKHDIYDGKMTLKDLIPPELWEEYLIRLNRSSKAGNYDGYYEHPIMCRDGSQIVVFCYGKRRDDGSDVSDILITDITSHIKALHKVSEQEMELRLLLNKLSFISEKEEEYTLDYNCRTSHFNITMIKNGKAHTLCSVDNYASKLYQIKTIHPDDLEEYAKVFQNAPNLTQKATFDFRSTLFTGKEYCWYRATYAPYHDSETDETHIIGRIVNINQEVMKSKELTRQAQIDSLTSLYNQGTTRSRIDTIALQCPKHHVNAFIIMDVDDFKNINDTYGHAVGDEILKHVGTTLRHFFRFGFDVIGRLGGDEFVVFMNNIPSADYAEKKCIRLCEELSKPYVTTADKKTLHITISIGVAVQDNGSDSFDHLYKCADEALYYRKRSGKNGFSIYAK